MTALQNPKTKLLVAVLLIAGLLAASSVRGLDVSTVARAVLLLVGVAGLAWWLQRQRQAVGSAPKRRMQVVDRTGLSPRCGLALVAIDGREFLVAYGDGFAEISSAVPVTVTASNERGGSL